MLALPWLPSSLPCSLPGAVGQVWLQTQLCCPRGAPSIPKHQGDPGTCYALTQPYIAICLD